MRLHLQSTEATLNGASLVLLTALLAAMRVWKLHGYDSLSVIRRETIPGTYGLPYASHEALVIRTNGSANDHRMFEELFEQTEEFCDLIQGEREITLINKTPRQSNS